MSKQNKSLFGKMAVTKIADHYAEHNFFSLSWSQLRIVEKQLKNCQHQIEMAKERLIEMDD